MNRKLKMLVITGLFSVISYTGFAQMSVSYYSSSLSKIGLGYNFSDRYWGEFKLYSNTTFENITPELVVCYNFVRKDNHNVYAGFGASLNYFAGVVFPVGVQFFPVEKFDRFSLHIELQPSFDFLGDLIIQSSWGIRYSFGKEK